MLRHSTKFNVKTVSNYVAELNRVDHFASPPYHLYYSPLDEAYRITLNLQLLSIIRKSLLIPFCISSKSFNLSASIPVIMQTTLSMSTVIKTTLSKPKV
jgi:hypothetical protein